MALHLLRVVLVAGLAAIVMLRGPEIARAQPSSQETAPSAAEQQAAKMLVDGGIAAMNANNYDKAIELYRKAYAIVPHPALLYNIGLAHKLAGRFDQAVTFYQRYLALAPDGPQAEDARAALADIQAASTAAASVTTREHDSSGEPKEEGAGGAVVAGEPAKVYVSAVVGTSFGYVTGKTEFDNTVDCCLGYSLLVITPELGYHVDPQLSIGMAARLGFPVGANIAGHSSLAPGGIVRVRYALSRSGEGVRMIGQLGFGFLRNTIKLDNAEDGMDTDIVAQGPLLLGGGIGYTKRISGQIAFVADLSALAALAVVNELGSAPNLNSGVSADLSLGLAVGF